ncbi:MAG: class II fructose-bisphosphatase [Blastocatellia bacterium]|nr:class II fructose-bisphosphatase [Chloracidobacterium sp.]MBL8185939.1 class II fructose-bisphosphatase [Blastocatellia bacterium]HBE82271.1 class II fructose-bisphosphatase [Blastocatellia bacterium]HRJ87319.1 class II fructose-bisphosphatase [Pyrinomonadaceae bacterium]HRK51060.1 class II fructose-bisphosphatase [Pyrinomonadaceae bacterium]
MKNIRAERDLALEFLRVTEAAAIESAKTMGQGDRKHSDHVAVEAMREVMDTVPMRGRIVIGEGERDEAPMLYIGEELGGGVFSDEARAEFPEVDIAVDPLEGTNLCALGANNAIAVLAAAERGGLLNAPDMYMDKIVVGPSCRGAVDIDAPVAENLKNIARRLGRDVEDLTVICLDRPRHKKLVQDVRDSGARIRLISDGDLSAGISAAVAGTNIHALMGIGGAPEGVITAAAMKCLNGEIQAKLVFDHDRLGVDRTKVPPLEQLLERIHEMGITDTDKIYDTNDLAPGKRIIFAATGVTDGSLLRGVRFFGEGKRTHSVVMTTDSKSIRFVDTVHVEGGPDAVIRF